MQNLYKTEFSRKICYSEMENNILTIPKWQMNKEVGICFCFTFDGWILEAVLLVLFECL